MKTILPNYDPKVSQPFNFKISTTNASCLQAAENLFQLLGISTGNKDHLKKRFIATLLLNLKLSLYNENMIAISLRPAHYAKQHKRYRQAIKTYDTVKKVIHAMAAHGLIQIVRGIKQPGHDKGVQTKIAPTEKILPYLLESALKEFTYDPPAEPIILRTREKPKSEIDYAETIYIKEWRKAINSFNDLRADSKITINNVGLGLFRENLNFFITNAELPEKELRDLTTEDLSVTPTKKTNTENPGVMHIASDKELLEDFLNELDLNDDTVVSIEDVEPEIKLDKYLWVIRQKEIELNKCSTLANESINRTQNWFEKKENTINSAIEFLSGQMRNYLKQNKLKSLSLPNGNIGLRKQSDVVIIQNEEIFLANAKPELLRHIQESYEPDLKAIKDYIKQSGGDLPKGVDLKRQEAKFYYKLSDDSN